MRDANDLTHGQIHAKFEQGLLTPEEASKLIIRKQYRARRKGYAIRTVLIVVLAGVITQCVWRDSASTCVAVLATCALEIFNIISFWRLGSP